MEFVQLKEGCLMRGASQIRCQKSTGFPATEPSQSADDVMSNPAQTLVLSCFHGECFVFGSQPGWYLMNLKCFAWQLQFRSYQLLKSRFCPVVTTGAMVLAKFL